MDHDELLKKYQALLEENEGLKARLGIFNEQTVLFSNEDENRSGENLTREEKIKLFMSLFKGRDDVCARRWQSKLGKSGYAPFCLNEWQAGICSKPKIKCAKCSYKSYRALDEEVIEGHLKGNIIIGIYPMLLDETCFFLAIDFDDEGWEKDVLTLQDICKEFDIPIAVERSRSGNGAHVWFFFEEALAAALARKFGTALLTYATGKRYEINFKSYDRFFPNQDTMPKGGFGNLIALPLQMESRRNGNSVFINEDLQPYADQWEFLRSLVRLPKEKIEILIKNLCQGNELGSLRQDEEEENRKPWEIKKAAKLSRGDFPNKIKIVKANMIYIPKDGFTQKALNNLKRLAAFKNPEFFKAQAMRMSTFNKPRIISCSDDTGEYLCLPRGCEAEVKDLLNKHDVQVDWTDKTNRRRKIKVEFNGELRDEQESAAKELIKHDNGVLSATTAFGKTVVAAKLIAERKVNTLVLVHRQQLLSQWQSKLAEFLEINEELPKPEKKRGRKKKQSLIGQLGAGKNNLSGIVDIAVMQSLNRSGEVKDCIQNYGMIIVDECHHISAFSFEQILKRTDAKYVYGLTATPARKDGHHPIIYMQCGPIRYRVDAKKQALKRPFEHFVIPRFTSFRMPIDRQEMTIQEIYSEIVNSEIRNQLIIDDVVRAYEAGRNCLVLTERTAHVEILAKKLSEEIPDVIALMGGMGRKETGEIFSKISSVSSLTLVATGKYIGEGFDEPRLDTLFLAMPISWKGTLQQYVGRLHRLYKDKKEVQVFDYVDVQVRMLEKMYGRRLNGYAGIGYKAKGESAAEEVNNIIFDNISFLPVYTNDLISAEREILIVSPFVAKKRVQQMLQYLSAAMDGGVKITVVIRPADDFKDRSKMALEHVLSLLENAGVNLVFKSNIHQKFAIIDQKTVWYGSVNLLSFGSAEENIMRRLESVNIASELIRSIGRSKLHSPK